MTTTTARSAPAIETTTAAPLVEISGMSVTFSARAASGTGVRAVDDFGIRIVPGDRVAIVGESGSGKTTACMAIAGFLPYHDTTVGVRIAEFDGAPMELGSAGNRIPRRRPGVTMIFQDAMTSLDPVWRIGSQFKAAIRGAGTRGRAEQRDIAEHWLRRVGLPDTERVLRSRSYELSGGMRQRVMLALAMCSSPRLLIADEPTSALDASLARDTMQLIRDLVDETGTALLMISHDIELTQRFCDRMVVMYGGHIVEEGAAGQIRATPRHPYTAALFASVPTLAQLDDEQLPTIAPAPVPFPDISRQGCPFRFRCPRASADCEVMPGAATVPGTDTIVRCWHPLEAR
ncbi:ABC transporter ATP-binding protein [Nocardia sp. NPDC058379]|uniref:ABC transporter ATP-binding protein n=1 Tax=unclassified Nocardia TaxID=2637762 RepID=UPI0036607DAF